MIIHEKKSMQIKDKDGNFGEVIEVEHQDQFGPGRSRGPLVGVHANGLWLTPAQAVRFAYAILRTAARVRAKRSRTRKRR